MSYFSGGPPRGGTRGGQGDFSWEKVKNDKYRENYLGHSLYAATGRWQEGRDLQWWSKQNSDRKDADTGKLSEIAAVKAAEKGAFAQELSLPYELGESSSEPVNQVGNVRNNGKIDESVDRQHMHDPDPGLVSYNVRRSERRFDRDEYEESAAPRNRSSRDYKDRSLRDHSNERYSSSYRRSGRRFRSDRFSPDRSEYDKSKCNYYRHEMRDKLDRDDDYRRKPDNDYRHSGVSHSYSDHSNRDSYYRSHDQSRNRERSSRKLRDDENYQRYC